MASTGTSVRAYSDSRFAFRKAGADYRSKSGYRRAGLAIAAIGVMGATVALVANIIVGTIVDDGGKEATVAIGQAWSFGTNTLAFSVVKIGIATILAGILIRLWLRVDSVKESLPSLKAPAAEGATQLSPGTIDTDYGKATVTSEEPKPLFIHRMARFMWLPSLAMGVMLVVAGFITSLFQAGEVRSDPSLADDLGAWTQGLQFLGEAFLLSGIAFILGTILGSLRAGGGEVQRSLGVRVKTLKVPAAVWVFLGLMMMGLMIGIAQFIGYIVLTTVDNPQSFAAISAWLGPFREIALGLILSGIVLALATIGKVLGFQFSRIREIIATGA